MKTILSLSLLLATATVGCHSVRRGEPITGPMDLTPDEQHGRVVFQQRCHQCHPHGEAGLGPALNDKPAPVFLMKTQVRAGLGAMPRFDKHIIPSSDLDDLMDYVMALRKADKPDREKDSDKEDAEPEEK